MTAALIGAWAAALAAVLVLALAAHTVGGWMMRAAPPELAPEVRELCGMGALGVGLFLIGMLFWSRGMLLVLLLPLAAVGVFQVRTAGRWPRWQQGRNWILLTLPLLFYLGLDALVPPMGNIGEDGVAYHLVGPLQWLRLHHIVALHDNFPTTYPALVETLFGAVTGLANVRGAELVALLFALLLLRQVWGLVRNWGGDAWTAGLAVALLAAMPGVMEFATRPFVDVAYAAFALAGARVAWAASRRPHWILAGALAGFCVGIKYTGLIVVAGTVMALWLVGDRLPGGRPGWRRLSLFAATALLVGGAWYLRNAIVFLAPVYPLPLVAGNHWPGRYFPPAALHAFEQYMVRRGAGMGRGPLALLLLPFHLTYSANLFHGAGGIGLVPLAFLPAAIARLWRQAQARFWFTWAGILGLLWFLSDQEFRFLMPVVAVWTVAAAIGGGELLRRSPLALRTVAWLTVIASLAYGTGVVAWDGGVRARRVASLRSPAAAQRLWDREVPYARALAFLNAEPDPGSVLLLDPSVLTYYLHRPYQVIRGPYGEQPLGPLTIPQALDRLPEQGITEVVDVRSEFSGFRLTPRPEWRLEFSTADARIYRVR